MIFGSQSIIIVSEKVTTWRDSKLEQFMGRSCGLVDKIAGHDFFFMGNHVAIDAFLRDSLRRIRADGNIRVKVAS